MRLDARTAELCDSFTRAGIDSILLKGPAIANWLYDDRSQRPYGDTDVLVAPDRFTDAEELLRDLGYTCLTTDIPFDRPWHAHNWRKGDHHLDLHKWLIGIGVSPEQAWNVFSKRTNRMEVGRRHVVILDEPARVMHIVLHAAQHGIRKKQPLLDLELAVMRVSRQVWQETVEVVYEMEAQAAFASGLSLIPKGSALSQTLGVAQGPVETAVALRSAGSPVLSMGFEWLSSRPTMRDKMRFLRWKLFPPAAYIRMWRPLGQRGAWGLAATYVWHLLWLVVGAPMGLRAWLSRRNQPRS
jgi:hypothetical protein